jgi:hypothetical protein
MTAGCGFLTDDENGNRGEQNVAGPVVDEEKPCNLQFYSGNGDRDHHASESAQRKEPFVENWEIAATWTVESRYRASSEVEAVKLFNAIAEEPYGALTWIRNYW